MTRSFVQNKPADFFRNKRAKLLKEQKNFGGDVIPAGTEVTITGKNRNMNTWLDIKSDTGIEINGIFYDDLELVKEPNQIEVNEPEIIK